MVVGLGLAAELADKQASARREACAAFRCLLLRALAPLEPEFNGDQEHVTPSTINLSVPGLDSETFMVATKGIIAVSNGSACTSQSYQPSHVLKAMRLSSDRVKQAVRLSWSHLTPPVNWADVVAAIQQAW